MITSESNHRVAPREPLYRKRDFSGSSIASADTRKPLSSPNRITTIGTKVLARQKTVLAPRGFSESNSLKWVPVLEKIAFGCCALSSFCARFPFAAPLPRVRLPPKQSQQMASWAESKRPSPMFKIPASTSLSPRDHPSSSPSASKRWNSTVTAIA